MPTLSWEQRYRQLISGELRGVGPAVTRQLLQAATIPYGAVVAWRNRSFDQRSDQVLKVSAPVISVGNITTGGTGKTPLICSVARWYRQQAIRVTVVSRGYKADELTGRNDEALELEQRLPDVPHLQNPDRVAAAELAIEELAAQLILLDDGFQHRRLARDLDIVVIDGLQPFGYGHLLPRGLLREPLANLRRADLLVLSRSDLIDGDQRQAIRERVERAIGARPWVEVVQRPRAWLSADGSQLPLESLRNQPVWAFCGIGNPHGFRQTLKQLGLAPLDHQFFPDHHRYSRDDLQLLATAARSAGAQALLCTHKDLVKINAARLENLPVYALLIDVEVVSGEDVWHQHLAQVQQLIPPDAEDE